MTKATTARPDLDPEGVLADCEVRFTRRSGPGGQNRNKVETAAILRHRPTGLSAEASERRSQAQNRAVALQRLRLNLALGVRRTVVAEAEPSILWRARCRGGRIIVSVAHEDFPALMAEVLDVLAAEGDDLALAGERLGTTASQIVKFLGQERRALAALNERRAGRGQVALKA